MKNKTTWLSGPLLPLAGLALFVLGSLFSIPVASSQIQETGTGTGTLVTSLGQFAFGTDGNAFIREIDSGTASVNPPSIATVARGTATFTITGAAAGDIVIAMPPAALNDDLLFVGADITGADTATLYIYNPTGGAIDDGANTWRWLWIDLT